MSNKVMIIGTGNVGASVAYSLINQRTAVNELVLVDINTADAEGEAMDLRDALAVAPSYMKIKAGSYTDSRGCDIIVITAGANQKPGETRLDLLKKNAGIFRPMIKEIMRNGFRGIFLVVTNPMDVMTYLTWKYSGLPSDHVIGSGTVLDSARLRLAISERLNVHPKSIHAFQVAEHGDSEFALWSSANLSGQPLSTLLSKNTLAELEDYARNEAYEIIAKKGATHYGIGVCATHIIQCILNDERRVLPVSSYDDTNNVFIGFPTIVGRRGTIRRVDAPMSEEEGIKYQKSVNTLKAAIKELHVRA
ncbi:L-lactate dehydrogenase [Candidatus Saccharibacteria bacterium]|nr:L-lactate dehydrogenase [Candidatus Saccharibacteria bacterium]